jgi:hypothetical protein
MNTDQPAATKKPHRGDAEAAEEERKKPILRALRVSAVKKAEEILRN